MLEWFCSSVIFDLILFETSDVYCSILFLFETSDVYCSILFLFETSDVCYSILFLFETSDAYCSILEFCLKPLMCAIMCVLYYRAHRRSPTN